MASCTVEKPSTGMSSSGRRHNPFRRHMPKESHDYLGSSAAIHGCSPWSSTSLWHSRLAYHPAPSKWLDSKSLSLRMARIVLSVTSVMWARPQTRSWFLLVSHEERHELEVILHTEETDRSSWGFQHRRIAWIVGPGIVLPGR